MYHPSLNFGIENIGIENIGIENIGVEEEYQLMDPQSRELVGCIAQSLSQDQLLVRERTPEMELTQPFGEAVIEVGAPVCADIDDARQAAANAPCDLGGRACPRL